MKYENSGRSRFNLPVLATGRHEEDEARKTGASNVGYYNKESNEVYSCQGSTWSVVKG